MSHGLVFCQDGHRRTGVEVIVLGSIVCGDWD